MTLTRYAACGNTFVIVFDDRIDEPEKPGLVRSIVAEMDGVIFAERAATTFLMDYFNRDGSRGEMCGNGARAFMKALYDRGECRIGQSLAFDTFSGRLNGRMIAEDRAEVSMPQPTFLSEFHHKGWNGAFYKVGVPHLVFFMPTAQGVDVEGWGQYFSHLRGKNTEESPFPASSNVNFFSETNGDLFVRTYERGVWRETASCGTGATACAAFYRKMTGINLSRIQIGTKGGVLSVNWYRRDSYEEFETAHLEGNIEHYL